MNPPITPRRWSRSPSAPAEATGIGRDQAKDTAATDRQPYAELAPLLGWDRIPELMRVLDE